MKTLPQIQLRAAGSGDIDTVTAVLAGVYPDSDLAPWLIPAEAQRPAVFAAYFHHVAGLFLRYGLVEVATAPAGDGIDAGTYRETAPPGGRRS